MSLPSFETNPNEASDKKEGVWTYLNQQTCGDPKNTRNYVLYWHILTMCVRFYWPKIGVVIRYQTWINTCTITDKHVDTIWYYIIYIYIWPHEKCLINQKWILSLGKMLRNASLHNTITDTFWIMSHSFGDVIHHNNNTNNKYHNNNNRYLYIYIYDYIYICYYI